jgi:hypothetical protein
MLAGDPKRRRGGRAQDRRAQAAVTKAGSGINAFMPTRQPGPQGNKIVSGPSGSFVVNKSDPGGSYTSLSTGKTFPIY